MRDLEEIEELIGQDAAQCLVRDFGGRAIRIPKRTVGSRLAESVGEVAVGKLIGHFGGQKVHIAKTLSRLGRNRRNREIRKFRFEEGCSIESLSARYNLCERQILRILSNP